jgi:glutamyl-tRNA synthetase
VTTPPDHGVPYRGRLAPSPTGYLHLGHASTFRTAWSRARTADGVLVLRNEDLDASRARPEFVRAMIEDLHWLGLDWDEGPDVGGPCGPYDQSARGVGYRAAFESLRAAGFLYPCYCSSKDIRQAAAAPHGEGDEPVYPGTCRPRPGTPRGAAGGRAPNWRFRVPEGETISFTDGRAGPQAFVAGRDFGDFVVWRQDDASAYQLAVVVDDSAMAITEVVRGADLLVSTVRQLLLYRALGLRPPEFYHCPLVTDGAGVRLAKRHDALSLRTLRERGFSPGALPGLGTV